MRPCTRIIKSYELRLFVRFADAAYAFSQGSIDALLATTPMSSQPCSISKARSPTTMTTPGFVDLMFNERDPALATSVVRHAIGTAIDRSAIVAGALDSRSGVIQTGPFSAGIPWVGPPAAESISPTVAMSELQANGWVPGADGVRQKGSIRLAFTLAVPDISPLPQVAHEVAAQLAAIGVQVTVEYGARRRASCRARSTAGAFSWPSTRGTRCPIPTSAPSGVPTPSRLTDTTCRPGSPTRSWTPRWTCWPSRRAGRYVSPPQARSPP